MDVPRLLPSDRRIFWLMPIVSVALFVLGDFSLMVHRYSYNNDFITRNGLPADFETLGLLAFFSFLLVQSVTMFLELQYVTRYNVIGIVGFHILGLRHVGRLLLLL